MKKLIFLWLLFSVAIVYGQKPAILLIPQPVELQQSEGVFLLTNTSTIGFDSQEGRKTAEMLAQKLKLSTGFLFTPQLQKESSIQFNLNKVPAEQLGKEGYTMLSTAKGVLITANQPAGLFY